MWAAKVRATRVLCPKPATTDPPPARAVLRPSWRRKALATCASRPNPDPIRSPCSSWATRTTPRSSAFPVTSDRTDGSNPFPFFQDPAAWETIHVNGCDIKPDTTYHVYAVCGSLFIHVFSAGASATTWPGGDVTGDGTVNVVDFSAVSDAANGDFGGLTLYNLDLAPCRPDGAIDSFDVDAITAALGNDPLPLPRTMRQRRTQRCLLRSNPRRLDLGSCAPMPPGRDVRNDPRANKKSSAPTHDAAISFQHRF